MQKERDLTRKKVDLQPLIIWFVLIGMVLAFTIAIAVIKQSNFLSPDSIFNTMQQVAVFGIASVGMTFVILTGGIDLSIASIIIFANIVNASLMVKLGVPVGVAILVSLLCAVFIGTLNGFLVAYLNIPPLIATFGTQIIFRGLTYMISSVPIPGINTGFVSFIRDRIFGVIPVPIIIAAIALAIGSFILNKTYFGRYFYAIGGNEEAAHLSGINTKKNKVLVYALSGLFAGIAGIVSLGRTGSAQPNASSGLEFDVITCVVLGGVSVNGGHGKISGVIAGTLIIGFLASGMVTIGWSEYFQMVVKGVVLISAVALDQFQKRKNIT